MYVFWNEDKIVGVGSLSSFWEVRQKVYYLLFFSAGISWAGNREKAGFTVRDDLVYRNKNIHQLKKIDLI